MVFLGRQRCAGVADVFVPGAGDGECCGAGVCLGDAKGLIRKVTLLEGELAEARWALEVAEEKVHSLSSSSAKGARRLVASKTECQEQFEELYLLRV
jgi:hypothetical protein